MITAICVDIVASATSRKGTTIGNIAVIRIKKTKNRSRKNNEFYLKTDRYAMITIICVDIVINAIQWTFVCPFL